MNQELVHVYLMPGMAANPTIFEYIQLPEDKFKIHWLEWKIPLNNESLDKYAERMSKEVTYDNSVLLGVSFGGILVQEMKKYLNLKKLIIVSSVKSRNEFPKRMKLAKKTKAYKLIPTKLLGNVDALAKYTFGKTISRRIELYKKYLSVSNSVYLNWAIEQMLLWERTEPVSELIHIHGDNDSVFPIKYINQCIRVKGGSHIMIINKYKWFNEQLPNIIMS